MNLHAKLQQRAAAGQPVRIGLIGAGKFGSMYLAQVPRTPGVHLVAIADLSPDRARAALRNVGWKDEAFAARSLDEAARLARVNDFVNRRVLFTADAVAWDQEDYWASPLQTLARGVGDCEDYAIAKYFILVAAGTPVERLRLVYVRATLPPSAGAPASTQAHMVLAHYADNGGEPSILDNLVPELRPSSGRPDLTPVFSFNGDRLWDGAGPRLAGDPMARLSRWRDVVQRAREEGFP